MDSKPSFIRSLAVASAALLAGPASAQAFSADYSLHRPFLMQAQTPGAGLVGLGPMRLGAVLHGEGAFAGGGLSVTAGRNWFGEVALGRSLQPGAEPAGAVGREALRLAGGYRWSDGQSLSMQLTGGRSRLGLSLSYGWPRYFVRLSYDGRITPVPQDKLRLSAGVRF